ncbi:hypothetical protein [Streptomyces bobili]|uniref:hypothetical protein n=1 Tax=Streptomyces bobili TaxID=67280 RepID=UPI000A3BCBFF|nr:hypothetical protein [Streptomyces bobili]
MGEVADIIKAAHDIFDNGDVPITVDERSLGMAYAIPRGMEGTVVETYSPWHEVEMKQVFYRESSVFGEPLAEIQLIMNWKYSEAQQYIIEAYLMKNILILDPTVSVKIGVRFDNPQLYDQALEAYQIPFTVTVNYDAVGATNTGLYRGLIRADGAGSFPPEGA